MPVVCVLERNIILPTFTDVPCFVGYHYLELVGCRWLVYAWICRSPGLLNYHILCLVYGYDSYYRFAYLCCSVDIYNC